MKMIISGGGTGGHISPAQAIIAEWQKRQGEVLYLGGRESQEEALAQREGINFEGLPVKPLPRQLSLKLFNSGVSNLSAFLRAWHIIRDYNPEVVVGTGGFTAGPVLLAAALRGYPTLIHEQNSYPGLTNRLLARVVDRVAVSFPDSAKFFPPGSRSKIRVTGNPVRPSILEAARENFEAADRQKGEDIFPEGFLTAGDFLLLVMGGSQGSKFINEIMLEIYPGLLEKNSEKYREKKGRDAGELKVVHLAGKANYHQVKELLGKKLSAAARRKIVVMDYLNEIEKALVRADLLVGRAGASTIAEITAVGLPSLLLPYPHAAGDHQLRNARYLSEKGAAVLLPEDSLEPEDLLAEIKILLSEEDRLCSLSQAAGKLGRPEAIKDIMKEILALGKNRNCS